MQPMRRGCRRGFVGFGVFVSGSLAQVRKWGGGIHHEDTEDTKDAQRVQNAELWVDPALCAPFVSSVSSW